MPLVTPDMVRAVSQVRPTHAARIAAYTSLRFGGLLFADAVREADCSEPTAHRYEKWLPLLQERFGLPEPPRARMSLVSFKTCRDAGQAGAHQRHHVQRGITSPDCRHCQGGAS